MKLPRYRDLPENEALGGRHCWGIFGEDDQLGRVNLMTEAAVQAAASEIRRGRMFNISLPLDEPKPGFGQHRKTYQHHIFSTNRNSQDDYLDAFYMQRSTQWDGLRHVSAREFGFYGGVSSQRAGAEGSDLGIERWVRHGMAGRGVLVDVPRYLLSIGTPFDPANEFAIHPHHLQGALERQGVMLRDGDILLLRTGYLEAHRSVPPEQQVAGRGCPGLYAGEETAEFLWDSGVAAIAADNPAVEVVPGSPDVGSLHRRLIPMLGFALGELFDLEELAEDCANDSRYTCFFVAVPLYIPGAVGSPGNPLAIK